MKVVADILCVALGAAVGGVLREVLLPFLPAPYAWVPVLIVNGAGTAVIGVVYGLENDLHPTLKTFAAVGFCGGFTTFSHFIHQTAGLLEAGRVLQAAANVGLSLVFSLACVWVGYEVVRLLRRRPAGREGA